MLKIYLAGYSKEDDYRKVATRKYGKIFNLFDPMKEVDSKILDRKKHGLLTSGDINYIVETDKSAITSCDIVVAYIQQVSVGTIMEILHSFNNQRPVYVIDPYNKFKDDIWLKYHTTRFFNSIEQCFNYIIENSNS